MMKAILSALFLCVILSDITAQEIDSVHSQSNYRRAWDAAISNGKISSEERVLLDIMVESMLLSTDSSKAWEQRWMPRFDKPLDQSGRWPLVLQNIAIGSGIYGWGIPYVLHADDGRWFVGGVMVSAGGAFYLTYKYTRDMEMSHARTQMMRYGSLLGLRYGFGVNQLLDLDSGDGEERETLWAWMLMASLPAGHYGGELLFDKYEPSNGQAWAWTMWTGIAGVTSRLIYNVVNDNPDHRYGDQYESRKKGRTFVELVSYPIGAYYGYQLTHEKQYTFGDALMLMQGWGFGFINTMMLQSILFDDGDEDTFLLVAGLGAVGSTFAYDKWIEQDDFSFGQSTLMLLGSASGTLFGFGTAILLDVTDNEPMLSMAMAGGYGGAYLTRQILDVKPDGSLAELGSTRMSMSPTVIPTLGSDEKVELIPGINMSISFK
ncbi:MAG: hypothetical protein HOB84_06475 [Candidatus Marinimicrobia bacterium]|nr:hypothetical protein [Candidatus Neomarinimicrobiota bacterium]MBT4361848.1 hypothetical protein [Candidatus Neomarinimicrobiota bacterium]MBT4714396.1 hypothetical protein [Candidatus Neomarinimicrobiota bacterium]MBT4946097.1 hypothetical protein [Candidatus Neomarinimicrobiota bacterium]MBT5268896.1 hypothetical protein [Candidatus Neomarinimicrobiota bacterium]